MDPKILIIIGSDSDLPVIERTVKILDDYQIKHSIRISSAHRTPQMTHELVSTAADKGFDLIIAAAGLAAALPGVAAAGTTLPVIGIPVDNGPLNGVDALYSIVQMPPGIPVGTMGIGSVGARNAAHFAARILSLKYPELGNKVKLAMEKMADEVKKKDDKHGT